MGLVEFLDVCMVHFGVGLGLVFIFYIMGLNIHFESSCEHWFIVGAICDGAFGDS
jgi:hypothetical protein